MTDNPNALLKLTRFRQRLSNLNDAFGFLGETLASTAEERIKNAATIKAFELTFELCWKALKDFLEYKGISVSTPRDVLKEAFKTGYLDEGQVWIDLLDHRNELVHVYNRAQAAVAAEEIKTHALGCIQKLVTHLNRQ